MIDAPGALRCLRRSPRGGSRACSSGLFFLLFLIAHLLTGPPVLSAQELDEVERLARDGQTEEARKILGSWWEPGFAEADRDGRQRGLWLRGVLTVDPALARLDFQRLMVEYPGTEYAARAIVRLARAAEARGEIDEAADLFGRLVRSYPTSVEQEGGRRWLDERGFVLAPSGAEPSRTLASPGEESAESVEVPISSGARRWAVQFGAFSSEARALTLLKDLRGAGLDVRIVQVEGSPLFRVRAGRYETETVAMEEMHRLRSRGMDVTVVSNADRESR